MTSGSVFRISQSRFGKGSFKLLVAPPRKRTWMWTSVSRSRVMSSTKSRSIRFAFASRRLRVIPQSRKITGQSQQFGPLLSSQGAPILLLPALEFVLGSREGFQFLIPFRFQGGSDQAIGGINVKEA